MGQVINLFSKEVIADDPNVAKQSLLEYIENQAFYAMDISRMLPTLPLGDDWCESDWDHYREEQLKMLIDMRDNLDTYRKAFKKDGIGSIETWEKIGGSTEFRKAQQVCRHVCFPLKEDEGNVQTIYSEHTPASLYLELTDNLTTVCLQAKEVPPLVASDADRAIWLGNLQVCFDQVIRLFNMAIDKFEKAQWGEGGDEKVDTFTIVNEQHPEAEALGLIGHNEVQVQLMSFSGIDASELGINVA
jgi:hypothetical protein